MSDEDITTDTNMNDNTFDDGSWIARNWRPLAALTYLTICLFDFIMFPILNYMQQTTISPLLKDLSSFNNPDVQKLIIAHIFSQWDPLTLKYAGLFHVSFGAILGVSAWKRGTEKVERIKHATAIAQINADTTRAQISATTSRDQINANEDIEKTTIVPTIITTNNPGA